jgi:virginiamycin B lyase
VRGRGAPGSGCRVIGARALVVAITFAAVLACSSYADAFVYWANRSGTTIARAGLSGAGADQGFTTDARAPCGVAVNGTHVHWFNSADGTIGRANLSGDAINQSLIAAAPDSGGVGGCGVAVDGTHLYWANGARGLSIGRANLAGTPASVDHDFISLRNQACAVAVDDSHVYWAGALFGGVGRADVDGGDVDEEFIFGSSRCGIAVSRSHIYWSVGGGSSTGIARAAVDGSPQSVDGDFIALPSAPCGIAVDRTHLYWGNSALNTIGRARLDGSGVNQSFVGGALGPCGVAVDALPLPAPSPGAVPRPGGVPSGDSDPPETTIDKAPKKKTKKRKARFEFSSDETGPTFECRLDRKPFAECASPFKKKVKRRKHNFEVRAIDRTGNVDPTPAVHAWKVKKTKAQTNRRAH